MFVDMKPKILMIGWELPPFNSGGLGEACFGLCKALSEKGVEITFVLPQKLDVNIDFMKVVFANGVGSIAKLQNSYTNYAEWLKKYAKFGKVSPFDFIGGALRYAEDIGEIAKAEHADIIHTHDWLTYPAGIVAKNIIKKPLVAHVHATEIDRTGGIYPNPIVYEIEKSGFLTADRVIPVGGFMKNVLIEKYGVPAEKITVVYNGINKDSKKYLTPALGPLKKMGYKIVLYLGRITLQKGPEYFVRAAKIVSEYLPKTVFAVTGSGDMQDYMVSEAARLGVLDKFIFTGFLRGDERDMMFKAADVYVMPSVSEPFGMVALEAVNMGTPTIISKQSGVSEVLKNALKVDFWDIEEIANKIIAVLKYKSLPQDLVSESTKEIDNLSWGKSADKLLSIYNQLIP